MKAKFQLLISENKVIIFFLIRVHGPPEIYPRPPVKDGCFIRSTIRSLNDYM